MDYRFSLILKMLRGGNHLGMHPVLGLTEQSSGEHKTVAHAFVIINE